MLKEGHDFAVKTYKEKYGKFVINKDPMIAPVIIGCIANDHLFHVHKVSDEVFKSALSKYKVFESQDVAKYM